jgi:hypothetical protein
LIELRSKKIEIFHPIFFGKITTLAPAAAERLLVVERVQGE